ncbi:MAG TPA: GIY-YIG nuclease family protein [Kofleriaceae bacterium]
MSVTKERVLAEIRRTAAENDGAAVGVRRFQSETGIKEHEWKGKFWRTWSDALIEAGFQPNAAWTRRDDEPIIVALIALIRKLGRFPSEADIKLARVADPSFPTTKAFRTNFGGQPARMAAVRAYIEDRPEYVELLRLLPSAPTAEVADPRDDTVEGHVYLMLSRLRSGKRYKIGHTESVPRRHRQVALELPEKPDVVHVIATDDPSGIEAYWHNRFAAKRTNGEWFALTADDVRAFKRRKFM